MSIVGGPDKGRVARLGAWRRELVGAHGGESGGVARGGGQVRGALNEETKKGFRAIPVEKFAT